MITVGGERNSLSRVEMIRDLKKYRPLVVFRKTWTVEKFDAWEILSGCKRSSSSKSTIRPIRCCFASGVQICAVWL